MALDTQAKQLNKAIKKENAHVLGMLSKKGKAIFFPKLGILSQSADANGTQINATIGTALEEDGTPMRLRSLAERISLNPKDIFPYAPSYGRPDIRSMWKDMLVKKNPSLNPASISLPVVTCALTHGLSMAGYLFVDKGDTIIMPDLYWENYELLFRNACGASFATFPMFDGGGFNTDGLRSLLNTPVPGKKIILLNFPNNPTGYTVTVGEAECIRDICIKAAQAGNDIVAIVDDAYFGLVYEDGIMTESIFPLLADAHARILAVKLDGPTKEDYVWGFRVGFVTFGTAVGGPPLFAALEAKLGGAIRGNISNTSNLCQSLLLAAYGEPTYDEQKSEKYRVLKQRYLIIKEILDSHPEYSDIFTPLPFNSGYFMCVRTTGVSAEKLRRKLISLYSTGIIAQGDLVRIAFSSTPADKLGKLFENIYAAGKEILK